MVDPQQVPMLELGDSFPARQLRLRIRRTGFDEFERSRLRVRAIGCLENGAVVRLPLKIPESEPAINDVALPLFPRFIHETSHKSAQPAPTIYFKRVEDLLQAGDGSAAIFGFLEPRGKSKYCRAV